MNSSQFRRWLVRQGCTLEPGRGGHLLVQRGDHVTQMPNHGGRKQLGKGVIEKIKKDLALK